MTTEERVTQLENKLIELIELLTFIINVDAGIEVKQVNWILAQLDEIKENL